MQSVLPPSVCAILPKETRKQIYNINRRERFNEAKSFLESNLRFIPKMVIEFDDDIDFRIQRHISMNMGEFYIRLGRDNYRSLEFTLH
jgi:hypothetical protein